jgi:hypothetical protein
MFWFYGFEKTQPYPLTSYFNYMDVDMYRRIINGLRPSESIFQIVTVANAYLTGILPSPVFVTADGKTSTGEMISALIDSIKTAKGSMEFVAIHVRRGDYWNKCKHIKDDLLRGHCYPSIERIEVVIEEYVASIQPVDVEDREVDEEDEKRDQQLDQDSSILLPNIPDKSVTIYIATNIGTSHAEFNGLINRYNVVFFEDLFYTNETDASEMALIDVELCSSAGVFFGNYFSSLSRSVYERREGAGRGYSSF